MMGDHRSISSDSREFGPVERSLVYGKAVLVYWPAATRAWSGRLRSKSSLNLTAGTNPLGETLPKLLKSIESTLGEAMQAILALEDGRIFRGHGYGHLGMPGRGRF